MMDDEPITEIDDERIATFIDESNVVVADAKFIGLYRRSLLEEGFDEDVVNEMCIMYHAVFVCKRPGMEDDEGFVVTLSSEDDDE